MPETEPKPDLDALLELLSEPDEEPRPKRIPGSVWLMLALILSMAGVWLAVKTATGELAAQTAALPMKPTKSKDRGAREEPAGEGSVVEDYFARCKRGMTAREVRWIVEDFQKAGLDEGPGSRGLDINVIVAQFGSLGDSEQLPERPIDPQTVAELKRKGLELAGLQQEWYGKALVEGLRLNRGQGEEVADSGKRFITERESDFLEIEDAVLESQFGFGGDGYLGTKFVGGLRGIDLLFPNAGLLAPEFWLKNEASAPWERVHLTAEQLQITRHDEVMSERSRTGSSDDEGEVQPRWMDLMSTRSNEEMQIEVPGWVEDVAAIFPVVQEQHFPEDVDDKLLAVVKGMHPAQFKIFLLLNPELAAELAEALAKAGE